MPVHLPRRSGVLKAALVTLLLGALCLSLVPHSAMANAAGRPAMPREGWREIRTLLDEKKFEEAEVRARALLPTVAASSGEDSLLYAEVLDLLVEAMRRSGKADLPETRLLSEQALRWKEEHLDPDDVSLAESLKNLADILQSTGRYQDARPLLERALSIAEQSLGNADPKIEKFVRDLGNVHLGLGNFDAALELYERSRSMLVAALGAEHPEVAGVLYNLALVYQDTGDYSQAGDLYRRALDLKIGELGESDPEIALYRNGFAFMLWEIGDYVEAFREYKKALAITAASLGEEDLEVANLKNNIGVLLRNIGDYAEAESFLAQALAIRERRLPEYHIDMAQSLHNLGSVYLQLKRFDLAERFLGRALKVKEEVLRDPGHVQIATTLQTLGVLHAETDDFERARVYFQGALKIWERKLQAPHPDLAFCLMGLGFVSEMAGDLAEARTRYEKAGEIRRLTLGPHHPLVAQGVYRLAMVLVKAGDLKGALEMALEAEAISRDHHLLTARAAPERQALAYAAIRPPGLDLALSLLRTSRNPADREKVWDAVIPSRALVLDEVGFRNRLLALGKDPELRGLTERWAAASRRYAHFQVLGPQGRTPEQFRTLLDRTRREKEEVERALGERTEIRRDGWTRRKVGFPQVVQSLEPRDVLVAFVRFQNPAVERTNGAAGALPRPDSAPLAELSDGAFSYAAFVIHEDQIVPRFVFLGPAEEIDRLIGRWREDVKRGSLHKDDERSGSESSYVAIGRDLRRKIWDPVADRLGPGARIFLVPDGSLHLVSFSSLPREESGYLIEEDFLIHYLSAERDLVKYRGARPKGVGLLAIGNPDFDLGRDDRPGTAAKDTGYPAPSIEPESRHEARRSASPCEPYPDWAFQPLPHSEEEVEEVAALWNRNLAKAGQSARSPGTTQREAGPPALVLTGRKATEAAFKTLSPGRRVLHLATHGYFLGASCGPTPSGPLRGIGGLVAGPEVLLSPMGEDGPLQLSGLALAGANHGKDAPADAEDGILTAEEISAMNLRGVEWAILSACDTGTGEFRAGEGIFGLRRAFHLAGVSTLIMSLWAVEDAATREWMTSLMRHRLEKGGSPPEALKQATLEFLAGRRRNGLTDHPFFWGAWASEGDFR